MRMNTGGRGRNNKGNRKKGGNKGGGGGGGGNRQPKPCRNWQATGTCPYGNRCRFSHQTPAATAWPAGAQATTWPAANPGAGAAWPATTQAAGTPPGYEPAAQLAHRMARDWSRNKSVWPFSCYGPVGLPSVLPGDVSFEELRVSAYIAVRQGSMAAYKASEAQRYQTMQAQKDALMKDPYMHLRQQAAAASPQAAPFGTSPVANPFSQAAASAAAPFASPQPTNPFAAAAPANPFSPSASPFG